MAEGAIHKVTVEGSVERRVSIGTGHRVIDHRGADGVIRQGIEAAVIAHWATQGLSEPKSKTCLAHVLVSGRLRVMRTFGVCLCRHTSELVHGIA